MAVQQNKKSRSKSAMRRAHSKIKSPELVRDETTGQFSRRHHLSADGTYRGKQFIIPKTAPEMVDDEEA